MPTTNYFSIGTKGCSNRGRIYLAISQIGLRKDAIEQRLKARIEGLSCLGALFEHCAVLERPRRLCVSRACYVALEPDRIRGLRILAMQLNVIETERHGNCRAVCQELACSV